MWTHTVNRIQSFYPIFLESIDADGERGYFTQITSFTQILFTAQDLPQLRGWFQFPMKSSFVQTRRSLKCFIDCKTPHGKFAKN